MQSAEDMFPSDPTIARMKRKPTLLSLDGTGPSANWNPTNLSDLDADCLDLELA